MILGRLTWPETEALDRDLVVLLPTGSFEQHGPHLPLLTDTLLAEAVAQEAERQCPEDCILLPALWLGASGHHLPFPGTLSHRFEGYVSAIQQVIRCLAKEGFHRIFVLNGHGGNQEPNGTALREMKEELPHLTLCHSGYYAFVEREASELLRGPLKRMSHACEAETSLMMHLHPDLVRKDRIADDGLQPDPAILGLVSSWDQVSGEGVLGFPSYADAETGRKLFEAAVAGVSAQIRSLRRGIVYKGWDV